MTTSTLSNDNGEANDASYDKYLKVPLDITCFSPHVFARGGV